MKKVIIGVVLGFMLQPAAAMAATDLFGKVTMNYTWNADGSSVTFCPDQPYIFGWPNGLAPGVTDYFQCIRLYKNGTFAVGSN